MQELASLSVQVWGCGWAKKSGPQWAMEWVPELALLWVPLWVPQWVPQWRLPQWARSPLIVAARVAPAASAVVTIRSKMPSLSCISCWDVVGRSLGVIVRPLMCAWLGLQFWVVVVMAGAAS